MMCSSARSLSSLVSRVRLTALVLGLAALGAVTLDASSAAAQEHPRVMRLGGLGRQPPYYRTFRRPVRHVPTVVIVQQPAPPVVAPPVLAPPPYDENGYLVLGTTPLVEAQPVRSYWGASYFAAQVLAVNPDGTVRVHYTGWSDMWDANVSRVNLRIAR